MADVRAGIAKCVGSRHRGPSRSRDDTDPPTSKETLRSFTSPLPAANTRKLEANSAGERLLSLRHAYASGRGPLEMSGWLKSRVEGENYMRLCFRKALALVATAALTLLPTGPAFADSSPTATPIKHLVVIFQENVPFDHYFGPYPNALNPPAQPPFHAA